MDEPSRLIEQSDISIFKVDSQTSPGDRRTLLDLQNIVRTARGHYVYLEVGSHLGGTLVPHLLDPLCRRVLSVDPRPFIQPDERGQDYAYIDNSTERMIGILSDAVNRSAILKLRTFDCDASELTSDMLGGQAHLALIDGEHTNRACFSDFINIYSLMQKHSVIAFHDADLIFDALTNIESFLRYTGRPFGPLYMPDNVHAIALGDMAFAIEPLRRYAFDSSSFVARARTALRYAILVHSR